jgi:hypothetical protein
MKNILLSPRKKKQKKKKKYIGLLNSLSRKPNWTPFKWWTLFLSHPLSHSSSHTWICVYTLGTHHSKKSLNLSHLTSKKAIISHQWQSLSPCLFIKCLLFRQCLSLLGTHHNIKVLIFAWKWSSFPLMNIPHLALTLILQA